MLNAQEFLPPALRQDQLSYVRLRYRSAHVEWKIGYEADNHHRSNERAHHLSLFAVIAERRARNAESDTGKQEARIKIVEKSLP